MRPQRRQRGRRRCLPRRTGFRSPRSRGDRGHARSDARRSVPDALRRPLRGRLPTARRERAARTSSLIARSAEPRAMSWVLAIVGFIDARRPPRARPLHRREVRSGCGSSASSSSSRRSSSRSSAARPSTGSARSPSGGFVKITGMNPDEELAAGGRPPRLLPPAGLEADRRDRRGAGDEHRSICFVHLLRARARRREAEQHRRRHRDRLAGRRAAPARRRDRLRRRRDRARAYARRAPAALRAERRLTRCAARADDGRLRGGDAGDVDRRARRRDVARSRSRPSTTRSSSATGSGSATARSRSTVPARPPASRPTSCGW